MNSSINHANGLINILSLLSFKPIKSTHKRKLTMGDNGQNISLGYSFFPFQSNGYTTATKENYLLMEQLDNWFRNNSPSLLDYNCIYINKNVKALKHKDKYNAGNSIFFYTGTDLSGGELMIYDKDDDTKVIHTVKQNEFYEFNGHDHFHETKPFTGERYSIIFYKNVFYDTHKAIQNYVICIPSYQRASILQNKTLKLLHDAGINPLQIFIYVSSKQEKDDYQKVIEPHLYNKIKIGKKGVIENRQHILDDYPTGYRILMLDDDIQSVDLSLDEQLKEMNINSLDAFIKYGFEMAEMNGVHLWGVYPVYNPFFREKRPHMKMGLTFIVGCWTGVINRYKDEDLLLSLTKKTKGNKDDVERSILFYEKDGGVLRFEKVGFKTKYYGNDGGGLGDFNSRLQDMELASKLLYDEYPQYGRIKIRKNGMHEFVLK